MAHLKKIGILYSGLLKVGGVESHLLSLFRNGEGARYSWTIIAPVSPEFAKKAAVYGVSVMAWQASWIFDLRAIAKLTKLLKENNIDLLHTHDNMSIVCGQTAAYILKIPHILTVHIPPYDYSDLKQKYLKMKYYIYLKFSKFFTYSSANHVLFVSMRAYHEAITSKLISRDKASLIQNGIDLNSFKDKVTFSRKRKITNDIKTICFVGRLDRQKGVDVLLDAVKLINVTSSEFRLLIVGDGPDLYKLQESIKNGLADKVVFLGYRDNVGEILMESDIFVLPSRFEGMSIALLEAMAVRLPSVVTNVGDNPHLVHDGITGYVVPPDNPSALAEKLQYLMINPELCFSMGNIAKQESQLYSDIKMVGEILDIYNWVLSS